MLRPAEMLGDAADIVYRLNGAALRRRTASQEMRDDHDDPDHQKYVDESHRHMERKKPQQP
jgi:hypothetical protein